MRPSRSVLMLLAGAVALGPLSCAGQTAPAARRGSHVLLLTMDGAHAMDLENYIQSHPRSNLAALAHTGLFY
ncbi:MAG: hypothetical protein ACRD2D_03395, partial [Terriglobales bacterium]